MLVTLRQLQYVLSVSKTGSFSKAAQECHAEQSTVSQQVKTLEDRLGIQLFDRSSSPIKTTPEGIEVIKKAEYILSKVDELLLPFKPTKK